MEVGINGRVFSVDQPGGAGQAGLSLTRALREEDISLTLYGNSAMRTRLEDISINDQFFPFNSQFYGLFWEQVILPKIIKNSSIDLLFCPTMNAPITTVDIPIVVEVHDIFRYNGDVSLLDKLRQQYRLPRMLSRADRIVTVSEFSKSEIVKQIGVPSSKIDIIYNGVDPLFFSEKNGAQIELPDKYLLYVGGTNARKNIPGLLRCFNILKRKFGIEHKLVMVGPDPKRFHNYPVDTIDDEDVCITGFISQKELKFVYENADIFLFPSLYEGFGMAPVEAMACGTPVVASNRASLPEILGDGASLINPENPSQFAYAAYELLEDEKARQDLIADGKRVSHRYTWNASATRLREVFKDVFRENQ